MYRPAVNILRRAPAIWKCILPLYLTAVVAAAGAACLGADEPASGKAGNKTHDAQIREIGTPVRSVNWVRLHPGRNRAGAFRQFVSRVPSSNFPRPR